MRMIRQMLSGVILLALSGEVFPQAPTSPMTDIPAFKEKLGSMSASLNTIRSDFVQEKKLSVLANNLVSKGYFLYRKENMIRWEYLQPYQYLIIINGEHIFIKEEGAQRQYDTQSNQMFREMNRFISGCIRGDILKQEKEYRIRYFEDSRSYFVTLVPVSEKMRQMLNEVQIWFDRKDLTVNRIRMLESGGDYTLIDFVNKKLNTEIPLEKFDFR